MGRMTRAHTTWVTEEGLVDAGEDIVTGEGNHESLGSVCVCVWGGRGLMRMCDR